MAFKPDIVFDFGADFDDHKYALTFNANVGLRERVREEYNKLQAWGEEVQKKTSITGMGWGFYHDARPYYIKCDAKCNSRTNRWP